MPWAWLWWLFGRGLLPDLLGSVTERVGFSVYDFSYAASLAVMLGVFIYTLFVIAEKPRPLNPQALKQGFTLCLS